MAERASSLSLSPAAPSGHRDRSFPQPSVVCSRCAGRWRGLAPRRVCLRLVLCFQVVSTEVMFTVHPDLGNLKRVNCMRRKTLFICMSVQRCLLGQRAPRTWFVPSLTYALDRLSAVHTHTLWSFDLTARSKGPARPCVHSIVHVDFLSTYVFSCCCSTSVSVDYVPVSVRTYYTYVLAYQTALSIKICPIRFLSCTPEAQS